MANEKTPLLVKITTDEVIVKIPKDKMADYEMLK